MKGLTLFTALLTLLSLQAQSNDNKIQVYVDNWWTVAVTEMDEYGIPASISLAQGILESGAGTSDLATVAHNHFGIKCHKGWSGKRVYADDDAKDECFRRYRDATESWRDHSEFLRSRSRYSNLFFLPKDDYEGWAKGLKRAGYATNPKYATLLIRLIEDHNLDQYDKMGREEILASSGRPNSSGQLIEEESRDAFISSEIFWHNRIKTVYVQPGDNPTVIAKRYNINRDWLLRYNDLESNTSLTPGEKFYLQPKRKKGKKKYHQVQHGESLSDISQLHGVRIDELAARNHIGLDFIPRAGERIYLRGRRDYPPKSATAAPSPPARSEQQIFETSAKRKENLVIENVAGNNGEVKLKESADNPDEKSSPIRESADFSSQEASKQALPPPKEAPATVTEIRHKVEKGDTLYRLSKYFNVSVEEIKAWNNLKDNTISVNQELIVGFE